MASVLETFMILFEGDASGVKKGAQEAEQSTDKLGEKLKSTDTIADKLGDSFKEIMVSAAGFFAGIVSIDAIVEGVKAAAEFADKLNDLSDSLGANIEDLSAWGDAVKLDGGTAEGFQETVKGMTAALAATATKGTSRVAPFFKELGISMLDANKHARSFFDILPEIADAFQKLSKEESFGMGQKMGLDQGTIRLLQRGRGEVEQIIARQRELGVVSKEAGEIADKFGDQIDDTAHAFRSLFMEIGVWVLPAITEVIRVFERAAVFFRRHSDLMIGGLIGIATAITYFVLPAVLSMVAAAAPFLLIAAAVGAVIAVFALLYDDIVNFMRGNDSLIGQIVAKWPIVGQIFKTIGDIIRGVITSITDAVSVVTGAFEMIANGYNKVKNFLGGGNNEMVAQAQNTLNVTGNNPLGSQTSSSIANSNQNSTRNTTVQTGPVTIQTQATDSQGIANSFSSNLNQQMKQAVGDFDDGVAA